MVFLIVTQELKMLLETSGVVDRVLIEIYILSFIPIMLLQFHL